MENVVKSIAVRILDIVRETITEIYAIAPKDYGLLRTRALSEVDLEDTWKTFFFRKSIVKQRKVGLLVRPSARCLPPVVLSGFVEWYGRLPTDLAERVPDFS